MLRPLGSNRFFRVARAVSQKSTDRVKIGAALVSKHQIISVGFNKMKQTHPKMSRLHPHKRIHAELDSIIGVHKHDITGSTLYLYRENAHGIVAMSKPCIHCQVLLKEAGIKGVYFTDPTQYQEYSYLSLV